MSNFSLSNWAGGNRTGAIVISNATNNMTFGNLSGITIAVSYGDLLLQNTSGATVLSNYADAINLTTSANDINITSGNNFTLTTTNVTGTPPASFGFLNVVDISPTATGVLGAVFGSIGNGVAIVSASQVGVAMLDGYGTTGGGGIALNSFNNAVAISGGGGVQVLDTAPIGFGSVLVSSQNNDVNIVSSNVGGGVNLSAVGTAGNITLTTAGIVSGVVISNIYNGGVGMLSVDGANHLYWNGTFIA
jgi:hypothetical protein